MDGTLLMAVDEDFENPLGKISAVPAGETVISTEAQFQPVKIPLRISQVRATGQTFFPAISSRTPRRFRHETVLVADSKKFCRADIT
jgi:hypothetical protein